MFTSSTPTTNARSCSFEYCWKLSDSTNSLRLIIDSCVFGMVNRTVSASVPCSTPNEVTPKAACILSRAFVRLVKVLPLGIAHCTTVSLTPACMDSLAILAVLIRPTRFNAPARSETRLGLVIAFSLIYIGRSFTIPLGATAGRCCWTKTGELLLLTPSREINSLTLRILFESLLREQP